MVAIRCALAVGLALGIASSSYSQFFARLWFKNVTPGWEYEGPGAVPVLPGHTVQICFFFDDLGPNPPNQWGTFQATLILDGISIISDEDANTWRSKQLHAWIPAAHFPIRIFHQPSDGPLYDGENDPADRSGPWIADKALWALIGVRGDRPSAYNFGPAKLFDFTVQDAPMGEELRWFRECFSGSRVSTCITNSDASHKITDNWIRVVPEPGSIATIAIGLVALSALRRRR